MYAVIRTGGKQYRVSENDVVNVEKLDGEVGSELSFDALAVGAGADLKVGTPTVEGAKVTAKIVTHGRAKKVLVQKHKRRKNYRRLRGHRQHFTQLQITGIEA